MTSRGPVQKASQGQTRQQEPQRWLTRARRGVTRRVAALTLKLQRVWRGLSVSIVTRLHDAGLQNPDSILRPVGVARSLLPHQLFLAQLEGLLLARSQGWVTATPLFQQIGERAERGHPYKGSRATAMLAPPKARSSSHLSIPEIRQVSTLSQNTANRVVVYTSFFGSGNQPPALFGMPEGLRFLCFTDQPIRPAGWKIVPTQAFAGVTAYHLICAHEVLGAVDPPADWSLYMDSEKLIVGNMHTLLTRWLMMQDFAVWRHPSCSDWHELAERNLVTATSSIAAVLNQVKSCEKTHLPREMGAWDATVIWRKHTAPEVRSIMDDWWRLHRESHGDFEISLYKLLHGRPKPRITPAILPEALGPAHDNLFFANQTRRGPPHQHSTTLATLGKRRLRIAFLCPEDRQERVTAILRGRQLSDMLKERFSDIYDVSFTSDIHSINNGVAILTPYGLNRYDIETITNIRARNIAVIGSWEDGMPKPNKIQFLDAHMTLSLRQMLDFNRLYPAVPAFHVTHHVNPKIPTGISQMNRLRTGYFGDLRNTVRPTSLSNHVELFDTSQCENHWLDALSGFNCHWIVRSRRPGFGWKPFLKGFVAARCGAVVIVSRDDANAPHYLGDDYPFYAESLDAADLEMAWINIAAAFGGQSWGLAKEIMRQVAARSSDSQVCMEFKAMMDEVVR